LRAQNDEVSISRIYRFAPMEAICGLVRGADGTLAELSAAPPLAREVPLAVLIAGASRAVLPLGVRLVDPNDLRTAQLEFAKLSTKGVAQVVQYSDHLIANSQPDAVTAAILAQLDRPAPVGRASR